MELYGQAADQTLTLPDEFASLPSHLLRRIFAVADRLLEGRNRALRMFPKHLHPLIISSKIQPSGSLYISLTAEPMLLLAALLELPANPPPFTVLIVNTPQATLTPAPDMDALLHQTFRHHSALHTLSLGRLLPPTVALLAPAIAALSCLTRLQLGYKLGTRFLPGTLLSLQPAFHSLSHLKQLSLHICTGLRPQPSHVQDHGHDGSTSLPKPSATEPLCICLPSLISTCTSLTSLDMHERFPHLAATRPLHMPHLRILTINGSINGLAGPFLAGLNAPALTALALQLPLSPTSEADPHAVQLLTSLAKLSMLRKLSFTPPHHTHPFAAQHATYAVQLTHTLSQLRNLEDLLFTSDAVVLCHAVPAALSAARGMRRLCVSVDRQNDDKAQELGIDPYIGWPDLLKALRTRNLDTLSILIHDRPINSLPSVGSMLPLVPNLTCLCLSDYRSSLAGAPDLAALACMTHVRNLVLRGIRVPAGLHEQLAHALQPMVQLEELEVKNSLLTDSFAGVFAASFACWPLMRRMTLGCCRLRHGPERIVRAAPMLQKLTRLEFNAWERDVRVPTPAVGFGVILMGESDSDSTEEEEPLLDDEPVVDPVLSQEDVATLAELALSLRVPFVWEGPR